MGEIPFPRIVACYKMDKNYDEFVRGGLEITVMDIKLKILKSWLGTWEQCLSV